MSPHSDGVAKFELDMADLLSFFVIEDFELDIFRFAHISARELLETRADFQAEPLHTMAVKRCLEICTVNLWTPETCPNVLPQNMPSMAICHYLLDSPLPADIILHALPLTAAVFVRGTRMVCRIRSPMLLEDEDVDGIGSTVKRGVKSFDH